MPKQVFLSTAEARVYLRDKHGISITERTLVKKRHNGGGPTFRKFGIHPVYSPQSLDEWVDAMLSPPLASTGVAA
jgi:hypothetical protein